MARNCELCGIKTIFYINATSRYFNVDKLLSMKNIIGKREKQSYLKDNRVVCFHCVDENNLMEKFHERRNSM